MNQDPKHFSLPPLVKRGLNAKWVGWESIEIREVELIGKILACHLIAEHYLTEYIREKSLALNWDNTNISFSRMIDLIPPKNDFLAENGFIPALRQLNRIRNKFSHELSADLKEDDTSAIRSVIRKFEKEGEPPREMSSFEVVNTFTVIFCAGVAGYIRTGCE